MLRTLSIHLSHKLQPASFSGQSHSKHHLRAGCPETDVGPSLSHDFKNEDTFPERPRQLPPCILSCPLKTNFWLECIFWKSIFHSPSFWWELCYTPPGGYFWSTYPCRIVPITLEKKRRRQGSHSVDPHGYSHCSKSLVGRFFSPAIGDIQSRVTHFCCKILLGQWASYFEKHHTVCWV